MDIALRFILECDENARTPRNKGLAELPPVAAADGFCFNW
jgi:hypothetical protein